MRSLVALLLGALCAISYACAQTTTPNLGLNLPSFSSPNWNLPVNENFQRLDSAVGRLQLPYQGAWTSSAVYSRGDQVSYQGSIYASTINSNFNNTPVSNSLVWQLLPVSSGGGGGSSYAGCTSYNASGIQCFGTFLGAAAQIGPVPSGHTFTLNSLSSIPADWTMDTTTPTTALQSMLPGAVPDGSNGILFANGAVTAKITNKVYHVEQFSGATADAQLNACIAATATTGGTCDATGYGAATQTIAATVSNTGAGIKQTLKFSQATVFQPSAANLQMFNFKAGARVEGLHVDTSVFSNYSGTVINVADNIRDQHMFLLRDIWINGSGVTAGSTCLKMSATDVNSQSIAFAVVDGFRCNNMQNGILLFQSGTGFINANQFSNITMDSSVVGIEANVTGTVAGYGVEANTFSNVALQSGGASTWGIYAHGATSTGARFDGNTFFGLSAWDYTGCPAHCEINMADATAQFNAFQGRFGGYNSFTSNNVFADVVHGNLVGWLGGYFNSVYQLFSVVGAQNANTQRVASTTISPTTSNADGLKPAQSLAQRSDVDLIAGEDSTNNAAVLQVYSGGSGQTLGIGHYDMWLQPYGGNSRIGNSGGITNVIGQLQNNGVAVGTRTLYGYCPGASTAPTTFALGQLGGSVANCTTSITTGAGVMMPAAYTVKGFSIRCNTNALSAGTATATILVQPAGSTSAPISTGVAVALGTTAGAIVSTSTTYIGSANDLLYLKVDTTGLTGTVGSCSAFITAQ